MSTSPITERLVAERAWLRDDLDTRALFGQVMALVALTIGFTATGAYVGRDLGGGWGLAAFVLALVAVLGLNVAATRSHSLALTLLFALGLLLGVALGPGLAAITAADPAAVWQAAGATALFTAALGSFGWATRRDLSAIARVLLWALVALIVFALVAIFVAIPGANLILALAGLVIFGGLIAYDFQRQRQRQRLRLRLRRAGADEAIDRREHLPRRPQRVPVLPAVVRRRQGRVMTAAARSTRNPGQGPRQCPHGRDRQTSSAGLAASTRPDA